MLKSKKKLIEVAMPLEAINKESNRDKKLSSGHPTTLHYWWAPRPLAACRAVVFASLVDDPSAHPERFPDEASQEAERERLFDLIGDLILWSNRRNARVLEAARKEIALSTDGRPPRLFDPFCGRGLIPLEGQRLGLDVSAADVNPIPVTIAKTLLEILPRFKSARSVHSRARQSSLLEGSGFAQGFATDVEHYAQDVLDAVRPALEPLYPRYKVTRSLVESRPDLQPFVDSELTVMAWLWARTVQCSNPACRSTIPLVGSFWLSQKKGRKYWIEPEVSAPGERIRFHIRHGEGEAPPPTKRPGTGGTFRCLAPGCGVDSDDRYVEQEGKAGRIGQTLMACIAEGGRRHGRVYLPATQEHEDVALSAQPEWRPDMPMPNYSQAMPTAKQGVNTWADLFTERQILTLDRLAGSIRGLHGEIRSAAVECGMTDDDKPLEQGGKGARAYADGIVTFLTLILGKYVNRSCAFSFWHNSRENVEQPFAQQGIQKSWDFVESNPFSTSSGGWAVAVRYPTKVISELYSNVVPGHVVHQKVADAHAVEGPVMVITDPPYYDNMGYADLSDFFYIWERRALQDIYPTTFSTVLTPKADELAAVRHRFDGDRRKAESFFVTGFQDAFRELAAIQDADYPLCLFYAYKQRESRDGEIEVSTGWETMLRGLIDAGLCVTGTWPMLSESTDTIKKRKSSLSTSIVLVCRKRPQDAPSVSKRDFLTVLREELPLAVQRLQAGNIPPVDLAQSAIGPGMSVFSRYKSVLDTDGKPLSVRSALVLINEILADALSSQEGDFDADTRWAIAWFEHTGFEPGKFGQAETLSTAKNTSVAGLVTAGIIARQNGHVRLLQPEELDAGWDPATDTRLTVWEIVHHLIRAMESGGEAAAAALVSRIGTRADAARELAYRLFEIAARKKWAKEALAYNGLVQAWPEIAQLAEASPPTSGHQGGLFGKED